MESDKYPITIEGKTYNVDRTLSNEPGVFKIDSNNKLSHINGGRATDPAQWMEWVAEPGIVVIIAREVYNEL